MVKSILIEVISGLLYSYTYIWYIPNISDKLVKAANPDN
jgi:hypothetical protein